MSSSPKRLTPLFLALSLSGCGAQAVHDARDPTGSIIGHHIADLIDCMPQPDAVKQIAPDRVEVYWSRKDTSTGFKLDAPLFGSLTVGGGGGCALVATVIADGTVVGTALPNCYEDNLFTPPYQAAFPLVSECLSHPNDTPNPYHDDAFKWLLGQAETKKP